MRVLSCNLISERELSWCLVAVSVDFLVPMGILSWQIPTFALNERAHLPLVPTRPHHVEVRRGYREPYIYTLRDIYKWYESRWFFDYQNLGHRHYFPQIIFRVFSLVMTLSIYHSVEVYRIVNGIAEYCRRIVLLNLLKL